MQRIEAAEYREIVQVSDPQLSPDDERVAFVRTVPADEETYEATVYVAPLGADAGRVEDGGGGDEDDGDGRGGEAGDRDGDDVGARRFTAEAGRDADPRWSPDGDRLAFTSTRGEGDDRAQLWVVPTGGGEARRVTDVAGDVSSIAWSPDGSRIAFAQRSTPGERDRGLDVDLDGNLGPDESYEREPPDPRVIDRLIYRADARYFDGTRSHVYVVDLEDDAVRRITDGELDFVEPAWGDPSTLYAVLKYRDSPPERGTEDPGGGSNATGDAPDDDRDDPNHRSDDRAAGAVASDDSIRYDVVAHDVGTGESETVVRSTDWEPAIAATGDGRVAHTHTPEERATLCQRELHVHDRATGETATVTDGLDRTVEGGPEWDPAGRELYFRTPDEGRVVLRRVRVDHSDEGNDGPPDAGDAPADDVDEGAAEPEVVVDEGHAAGFSVGEDAVAVVRSEWDHRGDVFATDRDGGEVDRLTRVNAGYLDERAVGEPEELRFESEDGVEVQGWVLTPPGFDPDGRYPLAVEIHGGPHAMWTTSGTMWHEFQTLAARGYVVFWCNPRGSTGYGEDFMAANERDWGSVTMADVLSGADVVAERSYVDEGNQFVTGGSFGGYTTGWIVGHTDRFRGAVAQRGVYELASFYGSTDAFKLVEWDFDAAPWEEPAFLWKHSPAAYADDVTTPTLVVHADADYRVPVNNGELFYCFLKRNGVETRLVRYPRDGHELSRSGEPGHVVDRLERIARWFDGYSDHHDVPPALERGEAGLTGPDRDDGGPTEEKE